MIKRIIYFVFVLLFILNTMSCSYKGKRYSAEFLELFDTVTEIVAYTESRAEFESLVRFIYDGLEEYHRLYNIYESYDGITNIKTINENAGVSPVKVDLRIIDLLLFGKEMYELTDGSVNIAMGSVLEIWHEHRERGIESPEDAKTPDPDTLSDAARHTEIDNIIIDKENLTVYLKDKDMSLDVGAIAKGYAAEQIARLAVSKGYSNLLLSVGGNVRALGDKGEGTPWNVGVLDPFSETKGSLHILNIVDFSLVASGNYQRYYTVEGRRYHHIIEPDTLMPADYFTAVTVLCKNSGLADALSTALFVMQFEKGYALIKAHPEAEAIWIMPDREVKYSENYSSYIKSDK